MNLEEEEEETMRQLSYFASIMRPIHIDISLKCFHAIVIDLKAIHELHARFHCNWYGEIPDSLLINRHISTPPNNE